MGSRLPTRQLALTARSCVCSHNAATTTTSRTHPLAPVLLLPSTRRSKWSWSNLNPFSRRGPASDNKEGRDLDSLDARKAMMDSMQGRLEDSIFDAPATKDKKPHKTKAGAKAKGKGKDKSGPLETIIPPAGEEGAAEEGESDAPAGFTRPPPATATELATDPHPRARVLLQRKLVAQMVRRGTRPATREERIARTERVMTFRSPWMATSVKKLGMLARQISGKRVDDALVQMKFSKKKFAREVAYRLREARDIANVKHGMGLGAVKLVEPAAEEGAEEAAEASEAGEGEANGAKAASEAKPQAKKEKPKFIQTREGKWIKVGDPTRIYIDEVWVNRGPFRPKQYDYKGRGRFGVIKPPSTSISFRLKEEKTRVRIHEEKKAKERKRAPWVHLPDRPIHGQRPYYSW